MKDRDVVVATNQLASDMRADETRSADNQDAHAQSESDRFERPGHGRAAAPGSLLIFYAAFARDGLIPTAKASSSDRTASTAQP
jgi:hypothetical protein